MRLLLAVLLIGLAASRASALNVGDLAPDVGAMSTSGNALNISDFKGSWLVLYFYPKSFTPGCTKEACSLRDGYAEIQAAGARILGVSIDPIGRQNEFKKEHNLPFDLLADDNKEVTKAFKALGLGGLMAQRKTFLIDPEGKIAFIFDSVNPALHGEQVLTILKRFKEKKPE